jgi:hypothetical protein
MPNLVMLWKWVRLAAGGERVVMARWWEPPPGAGPCADPRGDSPAIWLAGGGQGRAAGPGAKAIFHAARAIFHASSGLGFAEVRSALR